MILNKLYIILQKFDIITNYNIIFNFKYKFFQLYKLISIMFIKKNFKKYKNLIN